MTLPPPFMLNRMVFIGLCAVLVWAPLPFGSVHVWAYTVLQVLIFSLAFLYVLDRAWAGRREAVFWIRTPAAPWLLLFFLLVMFQLTPAPSGAAAFLSPLTHLDKSAMAAFFAGASATGDDPAWMRLAYVPGITLIEGVKVAAYLVAFFLTLHLLKTKQRIDALVSVLIAVGLFETLYAVYQTFSATPRILWWASRAGEHRYASGTFTVSNHFCFYLEMLLPLTAGFGFTRLKRKRRFIPGLKQPKALVQRMVGWFAPESPNPIALAVGAAVLVMGAGLLMSASRGGILSMGAAAFIMALLFFFRPDGRKQGFAIMAVCFLVVAYGLHIGLAPTLQKFEKTESLASRLYTSYTLLPIIGDYPAIGVGLGNLRYLYSRYAPPDPPVPNSGVWTAGYTHNDWLEVFTETGIAGGGLLLAAYLVFLHRLIRVWRRRRNRHAVGIGAGVITGMTAVGFHSFFDFSMRIPANPLTLAALAAIGYAALHRQGPSYNESFFYRTRTFHPRPFTRGLALLLSLILTAGVGFVSVRHLQAEMRCPTEYNSTLNLNWTPYLSDIEGAISLFPWNPEYHLKRARYYAKASGSAGTLRRRFNERAVESLEISLRLNSAQPYAWYLLGRQYARRDGTPAEYVEHWLPLADRCMDISVGYAPREESALARAALYWTWRAATLPEAAGSGEGMTRTKGIRKIQELFQRYLTLMPGKWQWAVEQVARYHRDTQVLLGLAPPKDEEMMRRILQWSVGREAE